MTNKEITDTQYLDWLADNCVIEGFDILDYDIHDYAADTFSPDEDYKFALRRGLRNMIREAMQCR